jgi:hypothetical protein
MGLPTIRVELDTSQPTGAPNWQDISAFVRAWSTRRGRQYERDRVQAGTATITLDNRDRRFDPTHAAGPYFGSLKPLRRMRISATWAGATYPVYTGYVDRWPLAYPEGLDATVTVQASDGLAVLSGRRLTASYPAERTDLRVGRVLDAASWTTGQSWVLGSPTNSQLGTTTVVGPVGDRALGTGDSTMQAEVLDEVSALEHLYSVQDVENGLIYVSPAGAVVFRSRGQTIHNRVSLATFGDGDGELPYHEITLAYDLDRVYNDVRVTRTGAGTAEASDLASQADYFPRTLAVEVPLDHASGATAADAEALSAAQWLLSRYKDARLRVASLTLQGQADDALWPQILGRDLGDVVTVVRRPPGGGSPISQVVAIQAISHTMRPGYWETRCELAPHDTTIYWKLGDPVASVLGVTTTPAY